MKVQNLIRKSAGLGASIATMTTMSAFGQNIRAGIDAAKTGETPSDLPEIIQTIIRVLLFVVGAASVIMLIIGGIRYTVSAGDQQAVANAKNTILYAIVGVVVALLAWAAVDYVFSQFSTT
jgi:hypothetical protein